MDQPLPPIRGGICPVRGLEVDPCHDTELNDLDTRQNQNFPPIVYIIAIIIAHTIAHIIAYIIA